MKNILFFDTECIMCNRFITFLLKRDKNKKIFFSSLQGESFNKLGLNLDSKSRMNQAFYLKDNKLHKASSAILYSISDLGYQWKIIRIFLIIPSPVRNLVYQLVSKYRHHFFSENSHCYFPSKEQNKQFID